MVKRTKSTPSIGTNALSRNRLQRYRNILGDIKRRIREAQVRSALAVNSEMLHLYFDIGRMLIDRQLTEGWGAAVLPRLAKDLRNELPGVQGFSERNLSYMIRFAREYPDFSILQPLAAKLKNSPNNPLCQAVPAILQQPAAKLNTLPNKREAEEIAPILQPVAAKLDCSPPSSTEILRQIPWTHHMLLLDRVDHNATRRWYMHQTVAHGWSRRTLSTMIDGDLHMRQGQAVTNFAQLMPPTESQLAHEALKDPYIFDFLTLEAPYHERELESQLIQHVEKFLIELGQGFAFVGRQYCISFNGKDYSIDLLFYHLKLRAFLVIDLKADDFKPEYAGKMNFYCNLVDGQLRHRDDKPTIGLVLCQKRDRLVAEYALKGISKAIGVSEYQLTRSLPRELQSKLPSIQQVETELNAMVAAGKRLQKPPRQRPSNKR